MKAALLFGNGQFDDDKLAPLAAPKCDVDALGRLLKDPAIGGFDAVEVLHDAEFKEVYTALGRLTADKSRSDTVLLYYSGHGQPDRNNNLYLATRDTNTQLLAGTAMPASEIRRLFGECRSRRQILLLDCCYSGAFQEGSKDTSDAGLTDVFRTEGYGQHVLAATGAVQRAFEGGPIIEGLTTSLFTHFIIQGIESGAVAPGQDIITVQQIYDYANQQVRAHTETMRPTYWVDAGEGDLIIARNPRPHSIPDGLRVLLDSEERYAREGGYWILGAWLHQDDEEQQQAARQLLEKGLKDEQNRFVHDAIKAVFESVPAQALIAKFQAENSEIKAGRALAESALLHERKQREEEVKARAEVEGVLFAERQRHEEAVKARAEAEDALRMERRQGEKQAKALAEAETKANAAVAQAARASAKAEQMSSEAAAAQAAMGEQSEVHHSAMAAVDRRAMVASEEKDQALARVRALEQAQSRQSSPVAPPPVV